MKTIVHAGFPKCASSSLQNLWFDSTTAFFAGKRPRRSEQRYVTDSFDELLRNDIAVLRDADFNLERAKTVVSEIQEIAIRAERDTLLVSTESLSGLSFARYGTRSAPFDVIVKRLAALFGEGTTVLLIIREQKSFLRSFHAQLIKQGYTLSFRAFIEKSLGKLAGISLVDGPLPDLRYAETVRSAVSAGLNPVWLPFEALVGEAKWLEWLSAETRLGFDYSVPLPHINKTKSTEKKLARNLEGAMSKFDAREMASVIGREQELSRDASSQPVNYELPADLAREIDLYFASSNAALSKSTFDLRKYGYFVAGS